MNDGFSYLQFGQNGSKLSIRILQFLQNKYEDTYREYFNKDIKLNDVDLKNYEIHSLVPELESTNSFKISPSMSVANLRLNVHNVERSLRFYHDLLGFQLIGNPSDDNAFLSPNGSNDTDHLLQISSLDKEHEVVQRVQSTILQAGLYHFAILLPSRNHLSNIFKHLTENSKQLDFEGAADHGVSESLYLRDPDSNGVEIYRDRDQSSWKRIGQYQVEMKTGHLDLKQLLTDSDDDKEWRMPADTVIGHIHLQVSDLIKSRNFYSEILGLHHTCSYPGANFFAADSYHHHIATNIWLGNMSNATHKQAGLDHFSLNLKSKEKFEELLHQLERMEIEVLPDDSNTSSKRSFFILDPNNVKIHVYFNSFNV